MEASVELIDHKNLATRFKMVQCRKQMEKPLRSVGLFVKRQRVITSVDRALGGKISANHCARIIRV